MKIVKRIKMLLVLAFAIIGISGGNVSAAEKQTIYNSPYVTFSSDGQAWTTNARDADYEWYDKGTQVTTGLSSSLRTLNAGEHYYEVHQQGEVPVSRWEVAYRTGTCIHNAYPDESVGYHGVAYGTDKCHGYYYSGWKAYCADCGEPVTNMYVYMSEEAAETIDYLELGDDMNYYYLCPHCTNFEQGVPMIEHSCKAISWNQYKIVYNPNAQGGFYGGYMETSIHMYNNAAEYEGKSVNAATHLTDNAYTRNGYEFVGWNTKPDGTGISYADGAEIWNLTDKDWMNNPGEGIITLYAQWRSSQSTLKIDPAGGTYEGKSGVTSITRSYGSIYVADSSKIKPPSGCKVTFDTNGGSAVASIMGTQKFKEWVQDPDYIFNGRLKDGTYYFLAPDGNVDYIEAAYIRESITLPETTLEGSNFGGWYADELFTDYVGGAGTEIIPRKDMTLYALWVDLKLKAENNMVANAGKGAVDLSWTQMDTKNKTYLLYQSRNKVDWVQIHSGDDITDSHSVVKTFLYTGSEKTYTVPYTGVYTLTAKGAQGGNYGDYKGGQGGSVTAKVWLEKGEILTYTVGGQNGYNGGGKADMFARGGGCTIVSSDRKGILLIAGGGGGAASMGNGGPGGSSAGVLTTGTAGESGGAGGGGGYRGGKAGELLIHEHKDSCYHYEQLDYTLFETIGTNIVDNPNYKLNTWMQTFSNQYGVFATSGANYYAEKVSLTKMLAHTKKGEGESFIAMQFGRVPNAAAVREDASTWYTAPSFSPGYIPTNGNTKVLIDVLLDGAHDEGTEMMNTSQTYLYVYDQNRNCIFGKKASQVSNRLTYVDAVGLNTATTGIMVENDKVQSVRFVETINLPEGTTGIYFDVCLQQAEEAWLKINVNKVAFSGGVKTTKICGYADNQVISSKPAYGGSNYVNEKYVSSYTDETGKKQYDGIFSINSEHIGFLDELELKDVVATDYAKPDTISTKSEDIVMESAGENRIKVIWEEPEDNGTVYYHLAESYVIGSEKAHCVSTPTVNTLVSGIEGYYYRIDMSATTKVTEENGVFSSEKNMEIGLTEQTRYLHVAAVDVAGNLGNTAHIKISSKSDTTGNVEWNIDTRQLRIGEGDNVYACADGETFYVRSDGVTPITLYYEAKLQGSASVSYQPNYMIYEADCDGVTTQNTFFVSADSIQYGNLQVDENKIKYSVTGQSLLERYPYSKVERSEQNRILSAVQQFTLVQNASGKEINLYPRAGVEGKAAIVYSALPEDVENGLTLIGDGEAPVISGLEILENIDAINLNAGELVLSVGANDLLSGVREFYVTISNKDNAIEQVYKPEANGNLRIVITNDEPIFSGDFAVNAYAVDNVGNEYEVSYNTTEFALEAHIERLRASQDTKSSVFKCGESGILNITTWGYAECVEVIFPEAMVRLKPELNQIYVYADNLQYKQEEQLQFMIPLYTPGNESYTIEVRAYKGNRVLEADPKFCTIEVGGDILEELRTRLR